MICKSCGKEIAAGAVTCPSCGAKFQIDIAAFQAAVATAPVETTKKKYPTKLVIGAIIAAIVIIIIAIAASGENEGTSGGITIDSESILENDLGSISNIKFDKLSYGGVNISGDFEASDYYFLSTDSYSYDIIFKVYDSDGKTLYTGDIYTPSVSANEKCSFLGNAAVQDSDIVDRIKFIDIQRFN